MPVKGIKQVQNRYRQVVHDIDEKKTYRAIYSILTNGAASAGLLTPVDVGTLLQSQYISPIEIRSGGGYGRVGYTAEYALRVHEASGKGKGLPRPKVNGKSRGNYWDPNAEPKFLFKGFELIKGDIPNILKASYRV